MTRTLASERGNKPLHWRAGDTVTIFDDHSRAAFAQLPLGPTWASETWPPNVRL